MVRRVLCLLSNLCGVTQLCTFYHCLVFLDRYVIACPSQTISPFPHLPPLCSVLIPFIPFIPFLLHLCFHFHMRRGSVVVQSAARPGKVKRNSAGSFTSTYSGDSFKESALAGEENSLALSNIMPAVNTLPHKVRTNSIDVPHRSNHPFSDPPVSVCDWGGILLPEVGIGYSCGVSMCYICVVGGCRRRCPPVSAISLMLRSWTHPAS